MINLFKQCGTIINYIFLAKKSSYLFQEKIEIFKFLFFNHLKIFFYKNREQITEKIFGFKITSFNHKNLQFLFKEIFLSDEYCFDSPNDSPRIIDCGANIGMAIFYFKKKYPNCSILAFEPNPHAFDLLKKNVSQNNLKNIQLFNIGLSNEHGELDFFIGENKGTLLGSFISARGGENKVPVKTQKLSTFLDSQEFDLIKMDIEGAETQVIENLFSERKLCLSRRYIIEYHHRINGSKSNFSSFIKQFEDNDYEYNIRTDFSETGGFQDILLDIYKDENLIHNM